jgi:hypothetical protein
MATLHEIVLRIEDYRGELRQPGSAGQGQSAHRPRRLRILHCDDVRSIQSLNLSCSNSSFRRDSMSQPGKFEGIYVPDLAGNWAELIAVHAQVAPADASTSGD